MGSISDNAVRPAELTNDVIALCFVERLWRSLKYENVYLHAYASVPEAKAGIGDWLNFYNEERLHQAHGYRTPRQIYEE